MTVNVNAGQKIISDYDSSKSSERDPDSISTISNLADSQPNSSLRLENLTESISNFDKERLTQKVSYSLLFFVHFSMYFLI